MVVIHLKLQEANTPWARVNKLSPSVNEFTVNYPVFENFMSADIDLAFLISIEASRIAGISKLHPLNKR